MATTTITLFSDKTSPSQATDYSFGMTLADVSTKIADALPEYAVISSIKLQFQCSSTVSTSYANVTAYVSLTNSDSSANGSSSTNLMKVSYKTSDGTQTPSDVSVTKYFNSSDPYSAQNTNYKRISVYFDTSNIFNKTFKCHYLRLYIEYEIVLPVTTYRIEVEAHNATTVTIADVTREEFPYSSSSGSGSVWAVTSFPEGNCKITVTPCDGYTFLYWEDDLSNSNPVRIVPLNSTTDGTTYIAICGINKIRVGTSQPSTIYFGTQIAKEVYFGTTKVYG